MKKETNVKAKERTPSSHESSKRFQEAMRELKRIQEEIVPFIKPREFTEHSTAGEWRDTTCLYL